VPDQRFLYRGRGIGTAFNLGTMATHTVVPTQAAIRIDDDVPAALGMIVILADVHNEKALGYVDLRCGKSDARCAAAHLR